MTRRSNRQIPPHPIRPICPDTAMSIRTTCPHSFRVYPDNLSGLSGQSVHPIRTTCPAYPAILSDALGSSLGSSTRFIHQRGPQALHHDQPPIQNHKIKTTRSNPAGHKNRPATEPGLVP